MPKQTPLVGAIALILAFVYFFPRYLIASLGPANPWTSYFYQYGLGLVAFSIGIYIILKSGACQFGRGARFFLVRGFNLRLCTLRFGACDLDYRSSKCCIFGRTVVDGT